MKKKFLVLICLVLIGFVSLYGFFHAHSSEEISELSGTTAQSQNYKDSLQLNPTNTPSATDDATIHTGNVEIDTVPDSYTVLINKEYGLSKDYVPDDLVVPNIQYSFSYYEEKKLMRKVPAAALEELVSAAAEENLTIKGVSAYRSYSRQQSIYTSNVRTKGLAHTEKYSAKPGYSEHQSGLAIDVSAASNSYGLTAAFGRTSEGKWLAENCYKFGFIIRYPEGKESITGYSYEPWHIRYVGVELATYLTQNGLTLEEYYNYTPSATISPDEGSIDVEEIPSATPEAVTAKTSKPSRTIAPSKAPSSTATPKATKTPAATKAPTSTPKATKTPSVTAKPAKTPAATAKPTKEPAATSQPTKEPTPKPTKEPVETATEKPVATKAPVEKPVTTADTVTNPTVQDNQE